MSNSICWWLVVKVLVWPPKVPSCDVEWCILSGGVGWLLRRGSKQCKFTTFFEISISQMRFFLCRVRFFQWLMSGLFHWGGLVEWHHALCLHGEEGVERARLMCSGMGWYVVCEIGRFVGFAFVCEMFQWMLNHYFSLVFQPKVPKSQSPRGWDSFMLLLIISELSLFSLFI